jgi:hypothetical protein
LLIESLEFCQKNKGIEIHACCIMTNNTVSVLKLLEKKMMIFFFIQDRKIKHVPMVYFYFKVQSKKGRFILVISKQKRYTMHSIFKI